MGGKYHFLFHFLLSFFSFGINASCSDELKPANATIRFQILVTQTQLERKLNAFRRCAGFGRCGPFGMLFVSVYKENTRPLRFSQVHCENIQICPLSRIRKIEKPFDYDKKEFINVFQTFHLSAIFRKFDQFTDDHSPENS